MISFTVALLLGNVRRVPENIIEATGDVVVPPGEWLRLQCRENTYRNSRNVVVLLVVIVSDFFLQLFKRDQ